jgi:hypothetical protein
MTTGFTTHEQQRTPVPGVGQRDIPGNAQRVPRLSLPVKAPHRSLRARPPKYWVHAFDDLWMPVVDKVSRDLFEAFRALEESDCAMAARKIRSVAAGLRAHATACANDEYALIAAERREARETAWKLASGSVRFEMAASAIEAGQVRSRAEFEVLFGTASWRDVDLRWRTVDRSLWFPVRAEMQRHFVACNAAAGSHLSLGSAVPEILKAASYLRLEEARARGLARMALIGALADLANLLRTIQTDRAWSPKEAHRVFARGNLALALAHRNRGSESWLRGDFQDAGYEFSAAGSSLASALGWAESRGAPVACERVLACTALADRLLSNEPPSRDDVVMGFKSLGAAVDALHRKIAAAAPHENLAVR